MQTIPDEYNAETFKRVDLLQFLSWVKKQKKYTTFPQTLEDANDLISEYLLHERDETMKLINKKHERKNK